MIGSLVFYKNDHSFVSEAICLITRSQYNHCAIVVGYDEETNVATIIEANGFIKTRTSTIKIDDSHIIYAPKNMTKEMSDKVVQYAFSKIGTEYDYFQILGLFISYVFKEPRFALFNSTNKFICSELVDKAYQYAGVPRKDKDNLGDISPQELFGEYDLVRD